MSYRDGRIRWLAVLALASGLLSGCEDPTAPTRPTEVASGLAARKPGGPGGSPGPTFTIRVLESQFGTGTAATDINDAHHVVGTLLLPDHGGSAFVWSVEESDDIELLPDLPGAPESVALGVNTAGVVVGGAGLAVFGAYVTEGVPVVWEPSGGGSWAVRALEGLGVARGINDAGEVAGIRDRLDESGWPTFYDEAVFWGVNGNAVPLPTPAGFVETLAWRINNSGDIAGRARLPTGVIHAVLWVRRGESDWIPILLQGADVTDLTDRDAAGTVIAVGFDGPSGCCQPFKWTVTIDDASGAVGVVRTALGTDAFAAGEARAVNAAGDAVGLGRKGTTGGAPKPALFPAAGSTVKLPLFSRTSEGAAAGISSDGWIVGSMDGRLVVWQPSS